MAASVLAWASPGQEPPSGEPQPADAADTPAAEEPQAKKHVVVEGQVIDSVGAGHEGVVVSVRRKAKEGGEGELIGTATTDELGDFKVTAAEPIRGDVVVTFSKPMYATLVREVHVGESEWPEFLAEQLGGNVVVIGRVIDALTNKPVAGAPVTLQASYDELEAKTDDNGQFTIKGASPGPGELIVEAKGYGREMQLVRHLEDFGEIVVRVKPERILHLKTVDDVGKPIAGVAVECYDQRRDDFRTYVTDKQGSVTMRGIHFDAAVLSLRLTHEEYVSSEGFDRDVETPEDKTESTHELVMQRAGTIAGRATAAGSGQPLNGARVMTGVEYSDLSPRDWADYQGNFTIRGVKPGRAMVTVHLADYAPELKTVEVKAGETTRLEVQLREGAVLRGIVKTETGKPVAGASVDTTKWRGHATLGLRAIADENGDFILNSAPHDEFEVTVSVRGIGRVASVVKAGGDAPVEFILPDAPLGVSGDTPTIVRVGDTAPTLSMTTLEGQPIKLADFKGKTVLLDFWATWCSPCISDLPHLLEVYDKFGKRKDLVIIGVSLDLDEKVLRDFLKKRKMPWYHVYGQAGGAQTAADRYGVNALPAVFVIGPDGKIVAIGLRGKEIVNKVKQVLEDNDST
jgi:peroxiredoxin